MNILEERKLDKLEQTLDVLNLTPNNKALALEYLSAETADDTLLAKADPENFLKITNHQQVELVSFLISLRNSKNEELIARFYKLFWAMGKGTSILAMTQYRVVPGHLELRESRQWCIDLLGLPAVAAMESHIFTWQSFSISPNSWLHELARTQPEVLEEAQTLCGVKDDRMPLTVAGILLAEAADEDLIRRQSSFLCDTNCSYFLDACQCLTDADKQNLAAYIRRGAPEAAVPGFTQLSPQGNSYRIAAADAQIIGLAGTASFLAAGRDPRARCALLVYARVNPVALLARLLRAVPREYLLRELDRLTDALPDGQAQLLIYSSTYLMDQDLKKQLAEKCRGDVEKAMKMANADQYAALSKLFPQNVAHAVPDMERRIMASICEKFSSSRAQMKAYLSDSGDLSHAAEEMKQFTPRGYCYIAPVVQLLDEYRRQCGWNGFACRCTAVIALLFEGSGIWPLICRKPSEFENGLLEMSEAMLAWKLPVRELLNIYGVVPTYINNEVQHQIETVTLKLLAKPAYLDGLAVAAREGSVPARLLAVSALHKLSERSECAEGVRKALLACTADSSKQVRELLQSILISHAAWVEDYVPLLKSKKAAQRLLAAEILGNMGHQMRPVLEEALAAEKSSKVADAIRNILGQAALPQGTGGNLVERILKGNKGRKIQWLLEHPLPELHRAADGIVVSEDHRAAILVAYCELGRIGRSDTAAELARDIADADLAALAHEVFERWMSAGAQAKTKWVLPFAAVFGGASMTPKLIRAINDWPQHARGAIACDAVTALALSTDPAALLAVDAISRKFKFRQVKVAAAAALENAARELGITAEELADRIVPDLGFGVDGKRMFDYGNRSFTVSLTPTLELEITNHLGKKVKNLPAPGKTDDETKAAAAYEAFKIMKKQIRTTISTQKARLEAALSALRCWKSDAWQALFVRNPIMHQFAISLIWGVYEDGKLTDTFRYMEDGSFNTVDEDEYALPEGASIGLVHPIELDDETLEGWKQQLEDYEITQSIQQLDRPVYPAAETGRSLERFGGKMLNGLSLAGKLLGFGWYRGSVQDGGMYGTFYREDSVLGYAVELRFSGAFVGDENDTVTVYDAVFYKPGTVKRGSYVYDEPKDADIFALETIPARYYSEIVYQLERATASSTETNENWKTER